MDEREPGRRSKLFLRNRVSARHHNCFTQASSIACANLHKSLKKHQGKSYYCTCSCNFLTSQVDLLGPEQVTSRDGELVDSMFCESFELTLVAEISFETESRAV